MDWLDEANNEWQTIVGNRQDIDIKTLSEKWDDQRVSLKTPHTSHSNKHSSEDSSVVAVQEGSTLHLVCNRIN